MSDQPWPRGVLERERVALGWHYYAGLVGLRVLDQHRNIDATADYYMYVGPLSKMS